MQQSRTELPGSYQTMSSHKMSDFFATNKPGIPKDKGVS